MNMVATYHVAGMTCDHCTMSVAEEVSLVADVADDLASGIVTVSSTTTPDQSAIASAVEEAGYELVS